MRNKRVFISIVLVIGTITLTACSGFLGSVASNGVRRSGNEITESRNVSGFSRINLNGIGELNIDQTGSESLRITADENFIPYLVTEVRGDTLYIGVTEGTSFASIPDITYDVTVDNLDSLEVSGAGNVHVANLDTDNWEAKVPGAGSVTVEGQTNTQTVDLSGAGSYDGTNLASQIATVVSSGAGAVIVQVSDELDVTISGLGRVEYIGNPQVTQDVSGLGSVNQRQ